MRSFTLRGCARLESLRRLHQLYMVGSNLFVSNKCSLGFASKQNEGFEFFVFCCDVLPCINWQ